MSRPELSTATSGAETRRATPRAEATYPFDLAGETYDRQTVIAHIAHHGFAVLRNAFAKDDLQAFFEARAWWFRRPAVGGTPGYCKFDHPKKVVQTSLLGAASLRILLDERILDLVEAYTRGPIVLSESFTKLDKGVGYVYFAPHCDYFPSYRPSQLFKRIVLEEADLKRPLGLSYILYHDDTQAGAFCFGAGSHEIMPPPSGGLEDYPEYERRRILDGWTRVDGKAGDIVIFDPRGVHGQDQPCHVDRIATVTRFWATDVFGHRQARPLPVYVNDLAGLSAHQLRVLGVGADSLTPLAADHHGGFQRRKLAYSLATTLIDHAFDLDYLRRRAGHHYRRLRSRLRGGGR